MALEIFTLRERPDLRPLIFSADLDAVWPEFMRHDAVAQLYFAPSRLDRYLDYAFVGVAGDKVVAGHSAYRSLSTPTAAPNSPMAAGTRSSVGLMMIR